MHWTILISIWRKQKHIIIGFMIGGTGGFLAGFLPGEDVFALRAALWTISIIAGVGWGLFIEEAQWVKGALAQGKEVRKVKL